MFLLMVVHIIVNEFSVAMRSRVLLPWDEGTFCESKVLICLPPLPLVARKFKQVIRAFNNRKEE